MAGGRRVNVRKSTKKSKNKKMPFFSIVTPSFNQGRYLAACLESVKNQHVDNYEQIVIDNCSTDETADVLKKWFHDPHLKIIVESDQGQSEAVNKGLRAAQGEIICWLNSDDAYPPETFHKLQKIFADPGIDVVFGDTLQISYDGKNPPERMVAQFLNRNDFIRWWSSRIKLHQPAVFFRRSVVKSIGMLDEQLHYAMDYEYWWRMSERYPFHYIPELLAIQHRQPDSKTIKAWDRVLEERKKIFSPHYGLLKEKRSHLEEERATTLAQHYLLQAYTMVQTDRSGAWYYFKKAWHESPRQAMKKSCWGLMRQIIFPPDTHT